MTQTVTHGRALRHEALVVRLDALLAHLGPIARKSPAAAVPAEIRASAEALLFEAQPFGATTAISKPGRRRAFPVAGETWAALALQLAEARAALDTFETLHAVPDPQTGARAWRIERGDPLPIARHGTAPAVRGTRGHYGGGLMVSPSNHARPLAPSAGDTARSERMRAELVRRLDARILAAYEEGYRHATEGRPAASDDDITIAGRERRMNQG